jgi:WD40 repeat protein
VLAVAVSPDGTRVASGSQDTTVRVWDTATGEMSILRGREHWVRSVAFSHYLVGTIRIWDVVKGIETVVALRGQELSPDGTKIVSSNGTLQVWDATTGIKVSQVQEHQGSFRSVVLTPDGTRVILWSRPNTIQVWDLVTASQISTMQGH